MGLFVNLTINLVFENNNWKIKPTFPFVTDYPYKDFFFVHYDCEYIGMLYVKLIAIDQIQTIFKKQTTYLFERDNTDSSKF